MTIKLGTNMSIKCNLQVFVLWWNQTYTFGESKHPQNFFI